ncbi:MAG TPA: pitrilysin family protein, partial [Gemmatimonadaceae bacterium]|nr:pitrilysin family protein [Gemmatimonadaceae bacterium]
PTPPRAAAPAPTPGGRPELERREAGVHVFRTARGLPILVWPKPGALIAYAGVYFGGGSAEEPVERAGLTKLLARVALKGTEHRTANQIAEDAEMMGGSLGGSAGGDSFGWSISVPTVHLPAALDLLADVAQNATVPDDAFETERAIAQADVAALRDDMYRRPMRLAIEAAYAGHPYGIAAAGSEASLASITAAEVRDWHRRRVQGGAPVVGIVADGDPEALAALAARHLARLEGHDWSPGERPAWPGSVSVAAESRDKAQTALALAFPAPGRRDPERFAAELLAGVTSGLGGRFFDELRDRQSLAYTVHAHASERPLGGMFMSYIATSPDKEEVAREGLLREFARLREAPPTADELQRAKTYALGTHAIARESGGSRLGEMVDAWLLGTGLAELGDYDTRIAAVTPEDVQRLAERYFDEGRRAEGIVRGSSRA